MSNISQVTVKKAAFFAAFFLAPMFILAGCSDTSNPETVKQTKYPLNKVARHEITRIQNNASQSVFLTSYFTGEKSLKSQSFGCEEKIYAVIQFKNHEPKLQQIAVNWEDPNGEVRENNKFPYFVSGEQIFAWSSLSLHRGVGAGMLQWINPAAGMEEFIGEWTVTITVKDLFEEKIKFEVLC